MVFTYHKCGSITERSMNYQDFFCLGCGIWIETQEQKETELTHVPMTGEELLTLMNQNLGGLGTR